MELTPFSDRVSVHKIWFVLPESGGAAERHR